VDVLLAHGRNLEVLAQAARMPGPRVEADVEHTAHAALIAELADRVCEDRHPVEGVYELTVLALEELAREPEPRRASVYFLGRALELLGFAPELSGCAACARPLPAAAAPFSPPAGGFLCADCAVPGMIPVSVPAIKVLRLVAGGEIELFRRLRLEEPVLAEVEGVLEAQLEHHLDRRLKSLAFLRQLRSMA
jgi:DNA repair protein RecO (recombination protein O)